MPDLSLSDLEHTVAKMLKAKYGFAWPFAAHIAKDVVCVIELEKIKAARAVVGDPRVRVTVPVD